MKQFIATVLLVATAATTYAQDNFTITGKVPGMKAGDKVTLVNRDARDKDSWMVMNGTANDGGFSISGYVDMPMLCEIRISQADENVKNQDKAFSLMVENIPMEVSAACLDSLPLAFSMNSSQLDRLKNVTVKAGEGQREFEEYSEVMLPYEKAAKDAHFGLYFAKKNGLSAEEIRKLKETYDEASRKMEEANSAFMTAHPAYHISALNLHQNLVNPFLYTNEELDQIWQQASRNNSPARVAQLKADIDKARKTVAGMDLIDFEAVDPDGVSHKISDYTGNGHYTLLDFWASWCGPCRAAIPHVREIKERFGDKLEVVAVSIDDNETVWKKAMDQEQMTWPQLKGTNAVTAAYNCRGIPFMVLIDPEGRIVYASHLPAQITRQLENRIEKQ